MLDKPTVSLITVQCENVEFIISSNETGVSPALNFSITYTTSGGNIQVKTVHTPVVELNLQEREIYTILIRVRNIYGYSPVSDPLTLQTSECLCTYSIQCVSFVDVSIN